jgi:uncharacterized coiled-coil protein SlyX
VATKAQLQERIVYLETELAAAHAAIAERDARIESLEERLARIEGTYSLKPVVTKVAAGFTLGAKEINRCARAQETPHR